MKTSQSCFLKNLYHFTILKAVYESCSCSTSSSTFAVINLMNCSLTVVFNWHFSMNNDDCIYLYTFLSFVYHLWSFSSNLLPVFNLFFNFLLNFISCLYILDRSSVSDIYELQIFFPALWLYFNFFYLFLSLFFKIYFYWFKKFFIY